MQFSTRSGNPVRARTHCLVLTVLGDSLGATAREVDKASKRALSRVLKRGDIEGKAGQTLILHDVPGVAAQRVMLLGLGDPKKLDAAKLGTALRALASALGRTRAKSALVCLDGVAPPGEDAEWSHTMLAEALESSTYRYDDMRGTPPANGPTLETVEVLAADRDAAQTASDALTAGSALAAGLNLAKDLGNTPANICTPTYLATAARDLARTYQRLKTTVVEEKEMRELGMGALLSVGAGSNEPSKLVVMEYKGGPKGDAPHAIVGKGITFDTGGISLKGPATMYEMIYDMCGAASVIGTMKTVAELELPINVLGVVASAENMPSASATRPGDVVKTMSGQTVEILNTDAEGRLVLCDALTYIAKYEPKTVVDIATLTGAIVTALGAHATGLFANDDGLADDLLDAGTRSLDRAWRLPIWEDYQSSLRSPSADMANVGGPGAGSITAACFLARFTKSYRWAHLDCAGTAYRSGTARASTGRPVPLLVQYLRDRAAESAEGQPRTRR